MQETLLASTGLALWRKLEANNVDPEPFFEKYGLNPAWMHESRRRYPYGVLSKAWREAAVLLHKESIGLSMSEHYSPLDLQALGVAFLSSRNLMEALNRLARYIRVINSALELEIRENDETVEVYSHLPQMDPDSRKVIEDGRLSVILDLARKGLSSKLDPVSVGFTYAEPENSGDLFGVFRCPLGFSEQRSRITFSCADTERTFTTANRELALGNDRILDDMLRDLDTSDIVQKVKRAIIEDLPSGAPSEEDVASRIFVSSRTLQRRLAEEDTSFRNVLLEVRRDLAEQYMADRRIPLAEISFMLVFSDTSSFSRAFKKWTGDPPNTYRQKLYT